ncbi:MAG: vraR 1 [Lacunisphaera sp.]|nr:vraR 1 [Lacunisphaera sp.]
MPSPTILCIEDDRLVREFLIVRVKQVIGASTRILESGNGASGLEMAREHKPDLVVLDLGLPDMSGFKVAEALHDLSPRPRILVVTAFAPDQVLNRIHHSPVAGLLVKSDASSSELITAIQAVLAGQTYFSQKILAAMAAARSAPGHFSKILSPREIELLPLFGYGWNNERIATRTGLSPATIRTHRQNILGKLDLHSTEKLIHWAISKGFADYRYEPKDTHAPSLQEPPAGPTKPR